jgi:hypothetical protein
MSRHRIIHSKEFSKELSDPELGASFSPASPSPISEWLADGERTPQRDTELSSFIVYAPSRNQKKKASKKSKGRGRTSPLYEQQQQQQQQQRQLQLQRKQIDSSQYNNNSYVYDESLDENLDVYEENDDYELIENCMNTVFNVLGDSIQQSDTELAKIIRHFNYDTNAVVEYILKGNNSFSQHKEELMANTSVPEELFEMESDVLPETNTNSSRSDTLHENIKTEVLSFRNVESLSIPTLTLDSKATTTTTTTTTTTNVAIVEESKYTPSSLAQQLGVTDEEDHTRVNTLFSDTFKQQNNLPLFSEDPIPFDFSEPSPDDSALEARQAAISKKKDGGQRK